MLIFPDIIENPAMFIFAAVIAINPTKNSNKWN
jgi:hypothetical protein